MRPYVRPAVSRTYRSLPCGCAAIFFPQAKLKGFQNSSREVNGQHRWGICSRPARLPNGCRLVAFWLPVWWMPLLFKFGKRGLKCSKNVVSCSAKMAQGNAAFRGNMWHFGTSGGTSPKRSCIMLLRKCITPAQHFAMVGDDCP